MGESWEGGAATEQPKLETDTQTAGTGSTDSISIPALTEQEHTLTALTDFLDLDNRPTFIVDLGCSPSGDLFYHNASLAELTHKEVEVGRQVLEAFGKDFKGAKAIPFLYWVQTVDRPASSIAYLDVLWTSKTIRQKWRVITGTIQSSPRHKRRESVSFEAPRLSRQSTAPIHGRVPTTSFPAHHTLDPQMSAFPSHREQVPTYPPAERTAPRGYEPLGRFDMTGPNPQVPKSSFTDFFLAFDWASTAIGPMNLWSPLLRRMCNFMLIDPRPAAIYCGKDKTMLYNEPYKLVTGQRHPYMMGKPFTLAWPEVQEFFLPEFDKACETGTAFIVDDARFHIERHGYIEETFYSIAISPFDLENGETAFYNPVFDTTRQVIAERRMTFLLRINQAVASSRELEEFWHQLIRGLDVSNPDVPFALLYSVCRDADETMSILSESSCSFEDWDLEGSVAVPENLTSGWKNFRAEINDVEGFIPNFKALINSESHTLLRTENGSLPEIFSRDIPIEGGNQRCEAAVFLPIRLSPEKVLGFLIIGVNPRKRYDEDYDILIQLLSRQLATAMASTLLYEDEVRRSRLASEEAEKDKILLSGTIETQKLEAVEIESRFRRMSDLAPAGMFHMDAEGVLIYANDKYYDLTQLPRDALEPMSWYSVIDDQDHPLMDKEWATLMKGETVDFELRLKRPFATGEVVGGEKVEGSTWIIAAAYAEKDANQNLVGVLGCITDISRQKWAEGFQSRKRSEAIELKRQQENFIDMTSHEIRNPLSAIMQCADWIATSTSTIETQESAAFAELAESYADAAQTILLCASHQGRIIDDILVLSKLDSDLLVITPVDVQPTAVINTAIKMFRGEMKKSGIEFSFTIEQSYLDLAVDWVKMDSNRLLQVLINLTANAIKFTQSESNKEIEISIGASLDVPLTRSGVQYLPRGEKHRDLSEGTAWGTGETIYLYVQVKDTGRGLDELERNFLFKRFSQSSPKTHIQYGGSGLGLFISRRLTELQGGQIGMSSTAGSGSTFAFYVRTRRAKEPTTKLSLSPLSVNKIAEETRILTNKALLAIQDSIHPPPPSIGTASVTSAPAIRTAKPQKSESSKASIGHSSIIKHVLVVEDNLVNQRVLVKQLTLAGCTVHVANHGLEALAFLESSQFWFSKTISGIPLSVILMDIEMPVMDGLTCVRKIRQLQSEGRFICHLPVIAVTANARPEQMKTAQEAGVDSVVTKPFRIGELIPEIEKWCVGGKARETLVHERSHSAPLPSGLSE